MVDKVVTLGMREWTVPYVMDGVENLRTCDGLWELEELGQFSFYHDMSSKTMMFYQMWTER